MVAFPNFLRSFQRVKQDALNLTVKGTSGTEIYAGRFDEEYLDSLLADQGVAVFDKMRRSDGQVKMLLSVVKNPIKSASWSFTPVDESEEEAEISEFASHVIMRDIVNKNGKHKTFSDFISEALTMIEFGFSAFEIVHKNVKGHKQFGDYLGLADLGFRHQRSIFEWGLRTDGSIEYVRQLAYGDMASDVDIPGQHLLVFSNEKEGDNYEGISMLRPCFGSYHRKNVYRKLQAIGIERAAKGVPIGTIPETMLTRKDYQTQLNGFQNLLDQLSAHQKNGIALGAGFDIKELKLSHDSEKVQSVINSENVEMSKSFLANFMELGLEANGGSYSLGSDLSDIFLSGIEYIGNQIAEKINLELVVPLVKAKYGERDAYPKLTVKGINDKAGKEFADSITELLREGALQKSTRLQRYMHELYNLPDLDEEIAEAEDERIKNPPAPPPLLMPPDDEKKKLQEHECGSVKLSAVQRKDFPVSAFIEDRALELAGILRSGLKSRSDEMLNDIFRLLNSGGTPATIRKAVLKLDLPNGKEFKSSVRDWAGRTAQDAFEMTLAELGKTKRGVKLDEISKMPKDVRERLVQGILLLSGFIENDLKKAVYFAFNENFLNDETKQIAMQKVSDARDQYLDKRNIDVAAVNAASNVTNNMRQDVFTSDDVFADIESFVFENPDPVSLICQSLVGTVFSKEEYETSPNIPPLHHNCKSYVTAQTNGDPRNKPLSPGGLQITDPKLLKQRTL